MPDGLKITLSGVGRGLTRDQNGRELLPHPFVFQCPPLEEHKVAHQFNFGNYDTILQGQFTRYGSRQLMTWQFDTLVMYLAVDLPQHTPGSALPPRKLISSKDIHPSWVSFPNPLTKERTWAETYTPEWYREQLRKLHDAGAPFVYEAKLDGVPSIGPILRTNAVLTGFSEGLKAGEGDCLYLEGVTFLEWRDPSLKDFRHGKARERFPHHLPTTAHLTKTSATGSNVLDGFVVQWQGRMIKPTLASLAKFFYGKPHDWPRIAKVNHVKHGGQNTPLEKLYPWSRTRWRPGQRAAIKIPAGPS